MPIEPSISDAASLPRGILLVEGYEALGVAISSALRKFAPLHEIRVARSFVEAETAAAAMRPELFVIDLDPPPNGEIEFFERLRIRYPEARALVIAAGSARELRTERGTAGALQFVEKPFDLAEFGAAVQALLGPWAAPSAVNVRGTLRDLHLLDIVQLKCLAGSTGAIRVEAAGANSGEIHFRKGQISHAATEDKIGLPALEQIVLWPKARLSEIELPAAATQSIEEAWDVVLLQVLRRVRRLARRGRHPLSDPPAVKTGKKILVIDDTEMLLIFVADILATADQNLQIITASTGSEGTKLAQSGHPDLVLLDYSLTDMTGDKVCRALLEDATTATIPILMMSGHLTELARTAEDYENVVATLPKPFLSGALINSVEKVLAAGPLPRAARSKPMPPTQPPPAAKPMPAPPEESPVSPNGHSIAVPPAAASPPTTPERAPSPVPPSPPVESVEGAPAPPSAEPPGMVEPPPPAPAAEEAAAEIPAAPFVRPIGLSVTLALRVTALQFTSSLQMESATLQLFDRIVAVKMGDETELQGVPLESGFRLGRISLDANGRIETARLVPTRQPPQLPVPSRSFAVGSSNFHLAKADSKLQVAASAEAAMRVRLTAQFELTAVELSRGFEVAAVLLKASGSGVLMRNATEDAGKPFQLQSVRLDSSGELESLSVGGVG